jgi:hypothetical protein
MHDRQSAAVTALALALASPVHVWSATRPRSDSWRAYAALFGEVFAVVMVGTFLSRYAAIAALQWLAVRLP